jgi:pimeloyl-ACP methyl ester carboxylesterase
LWHGFDRYDFVIDETTKQITPIIATAEEGDGALPPDSGTRRCILVAPRHAAPGNPWSWRGCYWDHQPQAEIELLARGFHIAYITTDPDETWDTWYAYLVSRGLSPKPSFIGMSRGGANAFAWATAHPDCVTAICADNPGLSHDVLMRLDALAAKDVSILNICGSIDPILHNTFAIQGVYHANGGRMSVVVKDGAAHHPHSLRNPVIIADFIEQSFAQTLPSPPAFLPEKYQRTAFYSTQPQYMSDEAEGMCISRWGAFFGGCYYKYAFALPGVEGAVSVIVPRKAAPGMPWVYRCDQPSGDSSVDLKLLSAGFHIVVAPVPYNADGPIPEHWTAVYNYFLEKGFAARVVAAGRGAATGEIYNWAIDNPGKVACIYGENPVMRASTAKVQPLDRLDPLAKAGVVVIHSCGSLDPNLAGHTDEVKRRYKGKFHRIIDRGRGHYPLSPDNPDVVASLIIKTVM